MRNNNYLGVRTLDSKELKQINGGFFGILLVAAFVGLIAFAIGNAIGNSSDKCD